MRGRRDRAELEAEADGVVGMGGIGIGMVPDGGIVGKEIDGVDRSRGRGTKIEGSVIMRPEEIDGDRDKDRACAGGDDCAVGSGARVGLVVDAIVSNAPKSTRLKEHKIHKQPHSLETECENVKCKG